MQLLGAHYRTVTVIISLIPSVLCVCMCCVAVCVACAGELLEVSIPCGTEAQAAAVDLILGKGCVRPLAPEDDAVIR